MAVGEGHLAHAGDLEIVEINFSRSMSIWWSLTWRAVLLSALAGLVFGAVAGASSCHRLRKLAPGVAAAFADAEPDSVDGREQPVATECLR